MTIQRMTVGRVIETVGGLEVQLQGSVGSAFVPVPYRSDHPMNADDIVWCVEIEQGIWVSMGPVFTTVDYFPDEVVEVDETVDIRFTAAGPTIDGTPVTPRVPRPPSPEGEPSGAISISGTVQVGETVTLNITTPFADSDGQAVTPTYQWLADNSPIAGATNTTLLLLEDWAEQTLTATATFTNTPNLSLIHI